MSHYNELATRTQESIRSLDWTSLVPDRSAPEITSRAKTVATLRDKLRRDPGTPLGNIQDIAGVRFECEMTLEEQDVVAQALAAAFDHGLEAIRDLRDGQHAGYRAVHVWLRLPQGRAEVQVRTHLQGAWANVYERLADVLGREIRYGAEPQTADGRALMHTVQELSLTSIAQLEAAKQVAADLRNSQLDAAGAPRSALSADVEADLSTIPEHEGTVLQNLRQIESDLASWRSAAYGARP
ncbi:hypothetical protein [Cellulomonas telluris]|uniref:hypothetical protein n=1 Tax=Cellulomonas telluris TaxID=2306636 RepID=UPI0014562D0E|nr:hypothetical protein [Cellulomonas telluris]